jgi:uncharacterized protein (TIGR03083 family)
MALARPIVCDGLLDELDRFEALLRDLSPRDWEQPTRCSEWTVGDVARHVVGTISDIAAGRMDILQQPERALIERQGRTATEIADECAQARAATAKMLPLLEDAAWDGPSPGGYDGTLGDGVEALWYDAFLHADDIRDALGLPTVLSSGLEAACSHVRFELGKRGWNGELPADDAEAMDFVLAATGRADATHLASKPLNIYADV